LMLVQNNHTIFLRIPVQKQIKNLHAVRIFWEIAVAN
jgi:hypothetical protein